MTNIVTYPSNPSPGHEFTLGNVTKVWDGEKWENKSLDNPHNVTKAQVGLSNVDNVSAASIRNRSTHTGTQTLSTISDAGTAARKNVGVSNGVASLNGSGKVPDSESQVSSVNGRKGAVVLSADHITYDSSETVKEALDSKLDADYMALKIFQSPTDGGLTEIQTRTVNVREVYEVRKTSDDSLATIYSDAKGTTEIVQNGTDNKSGSNALVSFYVASGEYYITSGSSTKLFSSGFPSELTQGANNGGCYIIFDDAGTEAKDNILPIVEGLGFKFGLAPYLFGIKSSYDVVTLAELLDIKQRYGSEIFSHGSYHVLHDAAMPLEVGESYINASAKQFNQYGLEVNGFIAPSSQLDSKFLPAVKANHDYAFIRSFGVTSPTFACNRTSDDPYDLARISLEAITLEQAKEYVDYAEANSLYVCFYTHTAVSYLEDIIAYMQASTLPNINPSDWVGSIKGLHKGWYPTASENLLSNDKFDRINTTSDIINATTEMPENWDIDFSGISGSRAKILRGMPTRLDVSGMATAAGEEILFTQVIETGAITDYTPMCFSVRMTGAGTNAEIRMSMRLKTVGNALIKEITKTQDAVASEQLMYITEGFIPDSSASYIEVEMAIISKGAGQTRCLFSEMQVEHSGKPTEFKTNEYQSEYFNQLRITTGATIQPNRDTLVIFNSNATGVNDIFDLTTGIAKPTNRKNYKLNVNLGLQDMVAGDVLELHLLFNGSPSRKAQFVCATGDNIKNASWDISANGTEYSIGIRHNGTSPRSITTYSNALLTVSI